MAISKKLDDATYAQLWSIFSKMNMSRNKVVVDFQKKTIEVEDDYSVDDIITSAGILTPDQGQQLMSDIKKNREEDWN
jgi:hypothetical protein